VASGEELAYDYAYVLEERHTPAAKRRFPCRCGAATCRGTILAKKR
jgi:SET domain-containing protein